MAFAILITSSMFPKGMIGTTGPNYSSITIGELRGGCRRLWFGGSSFCLRGYRLHKQMCVNSFDELRKTPSYARTACDSAEERLHSGDHLFEEDVVDRGVDTYSFRSDAGLCGVAESAPCHLGGSFIDVDVWQNYHCVVRATVREMNS